MAQSLTTTEKTRGTFQEVKFAWQSASDGTCTGSTSASNRYSGLIADVVFVNGTQPTDQYDVTITDGNSVDVLRGLGANLSNAATTYKEYADGLGSVTDSALTLNITNAGDTKTGTIVLHIAS